MEMIIHMALESGIHKAVLCEEIKFLIRNTGEELLTLKALLLWSLHLENQILLNTMRFMTS